MWKNATGVAKSFGDEDRVIRFGLKGSADILGILQGGKLLAIEVKTGKAVQTKEQKNFQKMVTFFGGEYVLARCLEDVLTALHSYKNV